MSDQLRTRRQQLCRSLYEAGTRRRDAADVKLLLQLIREVDQQLAVPCFEPPTAVPKPGDLVYLPTRGSIGHGYDDVQGGVGTVREVQPGISGGEPTSYVTTHEQPGRGHNWEYLVEHQAEYKQHYGDRWARPDPDLG